MGNKLVLITEIPFNDDLKFIANNDRDLMEYLVTLGATNIKIDEDLWLSMILNDDKIHTQLHWVKEI